MNIYKVTTEIYIDADDEASVHDKVEQAVHKLDCLAYDIITIMPFADSNGKRCVVYERQDETWIIKDMRDGCYITSCQSDNAPAIAIPVAKLRAKAKQTGEAVVPEEELEAWWRADEMCDDEEIIMGQSDHRYLYIPF